MDVNAIREAMHRQPFLPFTLRLADGKSLAAPHPDFIAVSPRRVLVIDPSDETHAVLEPLLIVSIEHPAPTGASSP